MYKLLIIIKQNCLIADKELVKRGLKLTNYQNKKNKIKIQFLFVYTEKFEGSKRTEQLKYCKASFYREIITLIRFFSYKPNFENNALI